MTKQEFTDLISEKNIEPSTIASYEGFIHVGGNNGDIIYSVSLIDEKCSIDTTITSLDKLSRILDIVLEKD